MMSSPYISSSISFSCRGLKLGHADKGCSRSPAADCEGVDAIPAGISAGVSAVADRRPHLALEVRVLRDRSLLLHAPCMVVDEPPTATHHRRRGGSAARLHERLRGRQHDRSVTTIRQRKPATIDFHATRELQRRQSSGRRLTPRPGCSAMGSRLLPHRSPSLADAGSVSQVLEQWFGHLSGCKDDGFCSRSWLTRGRSS